MLRVESNIIGLFCMKGEETIHTFGYVKIKFSTWQKRYNQEILNILGIVLQ